MADGISKDSVMAYDRPEGGGTGCSPPTAPPTRLPMRDGRTVRARIAVVVDARGDWAAAGQTGRPDEDALGTALDDYYGAAEYGDTVPTRVVWVTVDLPLPEEPPTVEVVGTVEAPDA